MNRPDMKKILLWLFPALLCCNPGTNAQNGSKAERSVPDTYTNTICADAPFHTARKGILIVGDSGSIRAVSPYSYSRQGMLSYARAVNTYHDSLAAGIRIYCMPIPTAAAFYVPDSAVSLSGDERKGINTLFAALHDSVVPVNIYTPLAQHAAEAIYSRTDHHWAPLGAYYAAKEFARVAQVPFDSLDAYDTIVTPNYVGTMYSFSRDVAVKKSPEDFVCYIPRKADYRTFYTIYTLDKKRQRVIRESDTKEGDFFKLNYLKPENVGAAYCIFGGGDYRLIKITTSTHNHRRLLVLKDSFGNAVSAYLLNSFEEIHVVDCRYFTQNIRRYVAQNGITDILFANNMSHAQSDKTSNMYLHYLEQ